MFYIQRVRYLISSQYSIAMPSMILEIATCKGYNWLRFYAQKSLKISPSRHNIIISLLALKKWFSCLIVCYHKVTKTVYNIYIVSLNTHWNIPANLYNYRNGWTLKVAAAYWILPHWGRVTHICVINLSIICSDNGLSPGRRHAIIWTNAGILLIEPLGTNFSQILIEI